MDTLPAQIRLRFSHRSLCYARWILLLARILIGGVRELSK
jgi:hypothetical protein